MVDVVSAMFYYILKMELQNPKDILSFSEMKKCAQQYSLIFDMGQKLNYILK